MAEKYIKRYSEAFKRQVVQEYEAGQSVHQLRKKYGINGGTTIESWIRKYSNEGFRKNIIVIQRPEEREREMELLKRVEALQAAVAQLTLEKIALEASLAEANQLLGQDVQKKAAP